MDKSVRKITVGDGITEKRLLTEADGAVWDAAVEASTLDGLIKQTERECFDVMAKAGLPTFHGSYAYRPTGEWHKIDAAHTFPAWGFANEIWPIAKAVGHEYDSVIGFAARMLSDVVALRRSRQQGDHERTAMFASYLMVKRAEQRIKLEREKAWKTGKKQTDTLTEQRERGNSQRQRARETEWNRWNEEATRVLQANPRLKSRSAIAALIIKRLDLSESVNTVRARLKKVDEAG